MPGMMDTVLNLGLNDETVEAIARETGDDRFAYDSYRRFIQMYSDVVMGLDHSVFEEILEDTKANLGHEVDTALTADDWKGIIALYKAKVEEELEEPFPQDPEKQLWGAIGAVFSSWMNARAITYRRLAQYSGKLGNSRQRSGDGVRQYGQSLGDRSCLHPQSLDWREEALRRVSGQRTRRGRRCRYSHTAEHHRRRTHCCRDPTSPRWRR